MSWCATACGCLAGLPRRFAALQGGGHLEVFSRFLPEARPLGLHLREQALAGPGRAGENSPQERMVAVSP